MKNVIQKYSKRGLEVTAIHVDGQFANEAFENAVQTARLIKYSAREHVSVAERRNRTIKERMRSLVAVLPYEQLPKLLVCGGAQRNARLESWRGVPPKS